MTNSLFDNVNDAANEVSDVISAASQLIYTKDNLFRRLVNLEQQMETIKADIKAAKEDFTQSDDNPEGLDKETVKEVAAFAKKYVAESVEKVIEQAAVFEALKEELIG